MSEPYGFEVVVVSYRSRRQVEGLLHGLPTDLPVVVVDNARNVDGVRQVIEARPHGRYVDTGGGAGFARAANLGVRTSTYDVVVFANPDSRPVLHQFSALVQDVLGDPRCASSSAATVSSDGRIEIGVAGWEPTVPRAAVHAVGLHKIFPRAGLFARPHPGEDIRVDWTTGACLAVRRDSFLELGGFDEDFYVYNEDVAFGRSVRERGMYQRLRTDLLVPHAAGGSGAPSLEMLRLRGASMRRYVLGSRQPVPARAISALLAFGAGGRAVYELARRDPGRAKEYRAYVSGVLTGRAWVAGVEVTARG